MVCDKVRSMPQVPRLPRMSPSATPARRSESRCHQVPRLPREAKVDVAKCHACHAKRKSMSPSVMPATRSEGRCRQVPGLPRETKVDVTKCHACHAKYRGVTGDQALPSARPRAPPKQAQCRKCPPAMQNEGRCRPVPRLPRETKVDVAKCHACHTKRRWMSPSATPATRNQGGCHQLPRLTRKVPRHHRRPSAPKGATKAKPVPQVPRKTKPSATLATRSEGRCRQVPRLPHKRHVCQVVCDKVV